MGPSTTYFSPSSNFFALLSPHETPDERSNPGKESDDGEEVKSAHLLLEIGDHRSILKCHQSRFMVL